MFRSNHICTLATVQLFRGKVENFYPACFVDIAIKVFDLRVLTISLPGCYNMYSGDILLKNIARTNLAAD